MKQKTKVQKGITLIALIITIVVLLILAAVAIASITNDGVLGYAGNAATQYNQAAKNEQDTLQGYVDYLNNNTGESGSVDGEGTGSEEEENKANIGEELITKEESYIKYYADVDADGDVDGIIFADLAFGNSGQWTDEDGTYSYNTKNTLNNYVVRDATEEEQIYTGVTNRVIAPIDKVEENDRFYVMALEDFSTEDYTEFYWYCNPGNEIESIVTEGNFGTGRANTNNIIETWNNSATQNNQDIWKHIQDEVTNGWFIPSRAELSAIAQTFGINQYNRTEYGFESNYYWSSSRSDKDGGNRACSATFESEYIHFPLCNELKRVRCCTTF